MAKITALRVQARNQARVNVYLDGKFAFGLAKILAVPLRIGQELDEATIARLQAKDGVEVAYTRALQFLGTRPRSEAEVRHRLTQKGVAPEVLDEVVQRLGQGGLINDEQFASFWVENRQTFRPRSRRVLRAELRQKGVSEEVVQAALADTDETEAAKVLAAQRARRLPADTAYQDFRRKLGEFLLRRGFGYDIIEGAVEQAWRERQAPSAD